jgi:hypothetical protein
MATDDAIRSAELIDHQSRRHLRDRHVAANRLRHALGASGRVTPSRDADGFGLESAQRTIDDRKHAAMPKRTPPDRPATDKVIDHERLDHVVAEARRAREAREQGYREQALKLFPWVCGRCARPFDRANLRELTVHHRDHDHDNNPSDGSNWELLCLYCHDNEHQRYEEHLAAGGRRGNDAAGTTQTTHRPFETLAALLKRDD